jgi:peptidoglycan/xylan/chitin deacetylase (PgdA/CDA1 family)
MIGYLLTTAALSVATGLGYSSMAPRSQLFGATFTGVNHGSRQIALTYDDGPNDPYTLRLVEVLEKYSVKATFFMLGRHVALLPRVAQAVAAQGHAIGNHTYAHPNLIFASLGQLRAQVRSCERVLRETVGEHAQLFRPPHGGRRPDVLRLVRRMGYVPVMWSVSSYDWRAQTPAELEARVARRVRGGDVILMHDGGHLGLGMDRSATVAATGSLIRRYQGEGYQFVTIPEMMSRAAA